MCDLMDCKDCKWFKSFKYPQCELDDINYYEEKAKRTTNFTDEELEHLWLLLTDVCTDENGYIDNDWFLFEKGTFREDIWHWFDEHHSKGVGWIMENIE